MDPETTKSLLDIMLCEFDPANTEKQKSYGKAERCVKQLMNVLVPELPIADKITDLCRLVLEKDITPINSAIEVLFKDSDAAKPVIKLFRILKHAQTGDRRKLKDELMSVLEELISKNESRYFETFRLLKELREGDVSRLLQESSNLKLTT